MISPEPTFSPLKEHTPCVRPACAWYVRLLFAALGTWLFALPLAMSAWGNTAGSGNYSTVPAPISEEEEVKHISAPYPCAALNSRIAADDGAHDQPGMEERIEDALHGEVALRPPRAVAA